MNVDEYKKIVKKLTPKENKSKNSIMAFFTGGMVGVFAQSFSLILTHCLTISKEESYMWTSILIILLSCIFTSLGFFDKWVTKAKSGLILPTTGFAHSVVSSALDYKRDGFVTGVGSNFFKLAGSVILYGIVSSFFFGILGVIFYG